MTESSTRTFSVSEILNRIRTGWGALDREPSVNDVVWFVVTPEGERKLHEGKEPNVLEE
jgi:hypothetical protein